MSSWQDTDMPTFSLFARTWYSDPWKRPLTLRYLPLDLEIADKEILLAFLIDLKIDGQ